MTHDPSLDELLAAIDDVDAPSSLSPDQIPGHCVLAASLIAQVVDALEESNHSCELLGVARAADRILDLLIQIAEQSE